MKIASPCCSLVSDSLARGLLGLCGLLLAALPAAAAAQDARVGFVDQRRAVFSSEGGKVAQKEYGKLEEEKFASLKPRREEVQRLEEEYESQKFVLSPEALQERRIEIMKRRRDLERDVREAEDDLQIRQLQLLQPIQKKIEEAVKEIGKEKGFSMIVDKGTPGLLYAPDTLDITDSVIQKLNEKKK